jgi:hypothetical protein
MIATIRIANMNCGGCAKGVLASLHKACLGAEASVDLPNRQVTLSVADTAPPLPHCAPMAGTQQRPDADMICRDSVTDWWTSRRSR